MKKLPFKNKYLLAPMLEPNDIAFRLLCKKAGAGLTYTGLINPQSRQKIFLDDKPALQLFTNTTKGIKKFIKKYNSKVSIWDFNLGCPAKLARQHKFGAYLTDINKIEHILKTIRENTNKPLTIKIRKQNKKYTKEIIKLAEKYCDGIAVHPRTKNQGYSGSPDLEYAKQIKKQTKLPIIYSGNADEKNAEQLLKTFDAVMIGRAAIGNPDIFAKLTKKKHKLTTFNEYLKLAEKYKLKFRQIKYQAMNFTKNKKKAKQLRRDLGRAETIQDVKRVMQLG